MKMIIQIGCLAYFNFSFRDAIKIDFPFLSGTCPDSVDPPLPYFSGMHIFGKLQTFLSPHMGIQILKIIETGFTIFVYPME